MRSFLFLRLLPFPVSISSMFVLPSAFFFLFTFKNRSQTVTDVSKARKKKEEKFSCNYKDFDEKERKSWRKIRNGWGKSRVGEGILPNSFGNDNHVVSLYYCFPSRLGGYMCREMGEEWGWWKGKGWSKKYNAREWG